LRLECQATGEPSPTVEWYQEDEVCHALKNLPKSKFVIERVSSKLAHHSQSSWYKNHHK